MGDLSVILGAHQLVPELNLGVKSNALGEGQLGVFWKDRPKNPGRLSRGSLLEPRDTTPTLDELGLDRKRAMRDLTFADVEEHIFEQIIATRRANQDLSAFGVYADAKRELARRANRISPGMQ